MGINFDELKNKATDALREHNDKIEGGLDKAADFAKSKFGHGSQIDSGVEKAKGFINKFDDTPDTQPQDTQPQDNPPQGRQQPGQQPPQGQ
ncbi:antitoxin [Amycolatopsis sp. NPDC051071]|uniref:antitoxin n=1 Tax=Amycolatopsis sp. NPDC051071 TaxID=3154637 RepID=UPI003420F3FC